MARLTAVLAEVRAHPPTALAGRRVEDLEDLLTGSRLPPSDVLVFTLDGARLVVRPSGTEPKLKCYAEAVVPVGPDGVEAARPGPARSSTRSSTPPPSFSPADAAKELAEADRLKLAPITGHARSTSSVSPAG